LSGKSFIGRLRHELLNEMLFGSLAHVPEALMILKNDYNLVKPHSAIGNLAPSIYAESTLPECNGSGRYTRDSAPRPVAPPSQQGSNVARTLSIPWMKVGAHVTEAPTSLMWPCPDRPAASRVLTNAAEPLIDYLIGRRLERRNVCPRGETPSQRLSLHGGTPSNSQLLRTDKSINPSFQLSQLGEKNNCD